MDIKQLRYFLQVCENGSMLQAAQNIFISQQALSKAIATLEKEIGSPLFYRTSKGLLLTEIGDMLRERSIPIVKEMDLLVEQIAIGARLQGGNVRLGMSIGTVYLLPLESLEMFEGTHVDLSIEAAEYNYSTCEKLVENGQLDLAVVPGPVDNKKLTAIHLADRRRMLLLRRDHALAQQEEISITDLREHPFALCINERCLAKFLSRCEENGFQPNITHHVNESIYMYELCESKGYLGLSIDYVSERHLPSYPELTARPFQNQEFFAPLFIVARRNQKMWKSMQELISFLCTVAQKPR